MKATVAKICPPSQSVTGLADGRQQQQSRVKQNLHLATLDLIGFSLKKEKKKKMQFVPPVHQIQGE